MKTKNEHTIQAANKQQRPNGSAVSEDLRKAGERVHRLVEDYDRWSAHRLQRALAWAVVVLPHRDRQHGRYLAGTLRRAGGLLHGGGAAGGRKYGGRGAPAPRGLLRGIRGGHEHAK